MTATGASPRPLESGQQAWPRPLKRAVAVTGLLCLLVIALFFDSAASMVGVWAASATFGHGFLIPPIVAYLVWTKRGDLAAGTPAPSLWGLAWMLGAALVWLLGDASQTSLFQHAGLIGMLQGVVFAVLGRDLTRRLVFPLGYMLFMIPFGDFAIKPLQGFTAEYTTVLLRLSGIPVLLENWVLTIPGGSFLVAEACSGVRFLIASLALGVLIAGLFFERWWKRLVFVALSILVPIGANVLRAYGIVVMAHLSNFEIAVGVDHLIYGFIFLSIVMAILIAIAFWMRDPQGKPARENASGRDSPARSEAASAGWARDALIAVLVLVVAGGVRGYGAIITAPAQIEIAQLRGPEIPPGWRRIDSPENKSRWRGRYPNADAQELWRYRAGAGNAVSLYIAFYADEGRGKELISSANSLTPSDRANVLEAGRLQQWTSPHLPAPAYRIVEDRGGKRVVWFWYVIDGAVVANPLQAKLLAVQSTLLGGASPSALVAVSAPVEAPEETALLTAFVDGSNLVEGMQTPGLRGFVDTESGDGAAKGRE